MIIVIIININYYTVSIMWVEYGLKFKVSNLKAGGLSLNLCRDGQFFKSVLEVDNYFKSVCSNTSYMGRKYVHVTTSGDIVQVIQFQHVWVLLPMDLECFEKE